MTLFVLRVDGAEVDVSRSRYRFDQLVRQGFWEGRDVEVVEETADYSPISREELPEEFPTAGVSDSEIGALLGGLAHE